MTSTEMPSSLGAFLVQHPSEMKKIISAIYGLRAHLAKLPDDLDEAILIEFLQEDDGGHYGLLECLHHAALDVGTVLAELLNRSHKEDLKSMIKATTDRDLADPLRRNSGLDLIMALNRAVELMGKPRRIEVLRTADDVMPVGQVGA